MTRTRIKILMMATRIPVALYLFVALLSVGNAAPPDVTKHPRDLSVPEVTKDEPVPGKRVLQALPDYENSKVRHALYLPTDWVNGKTYSVIAEYTGNNGTVAGGKACQGYGISGGKGFLWITLPFVSEDGKTDMDWWWGDPDRTADYAIAAIKSVCKKWGGNPKAVILTGHSRGAIACNYIGLRNDDIAKLWLGMIPASHYDNRPWKQGKAEFSRKVERLRRLGKTPQFVCGEHHLAEQHNDKKLLAMVQTENYASLEAVKRDLNLQTILIQEGIQAFITKNHPNARITFHTFPWVNHDGQWTLYDTSSRKKLRNWVNELTAQIPSANRKGVPSKLKK